MSDDASIKNISIFNGTGESAPLVVVTTMTNKKFAVKTSQHFKYEKAETWKMGFEVCFEKEERRRSLEEP